MLNALLILAGAAVLGLLLMEVLVTALTLRGSGSLTGRLTRALWTAVLGLHRRRPAHRLLQSAGPVLAALTLAVWAGLLWLGWGLVFAGAGDAIVDGATGAPADLSSRVYFAGFNIFTLGLGDFRPVGGLWQMITALSAASGLVIITLAITYLAPVLNGAVARQGLAIQIVLLGETPADVVRRAVTGGPDRMADAVSAVTPSLVQLSRQHLSHPLVHYFHIPDPRLSLPLRLAVLHEALLVLRYGRSPEPAEAMTLDEGLAAIGYFLQAMEAELLRRAGRTPPPPDLAGLRLDGAPDRAGLDAGFARHAGRRRSLLALVERDGWSWDDVAAACPRPVGVRPD